MPFTMGEIFYYEMAHYLMDYVLQISFITYTGTELMWQVFQTTFVQKGKAIIEALIQ